MKKNVIIGVCAGIASYKTCELVRLLSKDGFSVKVVMTESATKFVSPLVFQTLSNNPVYVDMFSLIKEENPQHIDIAQWANLCVIAPCTANTLSKIASGICDNLLTTVVCALPEKAKVLLAPAMNECMWKNPLIEKNVEVLKSLKKYIIMPPAKGELVCGTYGQGRMPDVTDIYKRIKGILR
ncbi:MAG: flavoprotein [Candidatus Omnitrophica bacterium]|nr:flavoprotein [Candidatus Omnitrophota bacterium]